MSHTQEKLAPAIKGLPAAILNSLLILFAIVLFVVAMYSPATPLWIAIAIISIVYATIIGPLLFIGLKSIRPNEALVLTLFGNYYGTLKKEGLYMVNPFCSSINPTLEPEKPLPSTSEKATGMQKYANLSSSRQSKKISLKAMTLNNEKQKVNDALGNPIIIGIVVIWRVVDTAKAVFQVDNYIEYLSIQSDAALRNIIRLYPYDATDEEGETSLRGSSVEVATKLQNEIQEKMDKAGIEILEARITHLSYAPEIAAAMLQKQQATAIIAARQMIVEGAVGMVEMALEQLSAKEVVVLDEERKAAMVSNLLVILCGNKDAQPIVNSGTIY
ncbi:MAG: SPFH domain-containing protein [Sphaerochaetaceae bacterium]